jgi:hypothetical protein
MVVSNPDRPFQVSVAKPEAFSPEMQAMRVQNLAYEPLPQGSGIIPPIKATLAHIDGKPMYICAVYSNDGDFDVRAAGSHKSADELPLRSPEMVALGVGEPFNHIQIDKVVETRHVIAESKKRGS